MSAFMILKSKITLQGWSWDHRGNSTQMGVGSSQLLMQIFPALALYLSGSGYSQPGGPNCCNEYKLAASWFLYPGDKSRRGKS